MRRAIIILVAAFIFFPSITGAQELRQGCFQNTEAYKMLESIGGAMYFAGLGGKAKTALELWIGLNQAWAVTVINDEQICIIDFGDRSVVFNEGLPADISRKVEEERQQKKR